MIVFFDLPVVTARERKAATKFRNFLLKDGYHMIQFSVYSRICNGMDSVEKHEARLNLANNCQDVFLKKFCFKKGRI